jgi:hypothetical protein
MQKIAYRGGYVFSLDGRIFQTHATFYLHPRGIFDRADGGFGSNLSNQKLEYLGNYRNDYFRNVEMINIRKYEDDEK